MGPTASLVYDLIRFVLCDATCVQIWVNALIWSHFQDKLWCVPAGAVFNL